MVDHKTSTVVVVVRGSMSMRDAFTDLTAIPEKIEGEGIPPNSMVGIVVFS